MVPAGQMYLQKVGRGSVPESVCDGDDEYEEHQDHIFEVGEDPGDAALFQFGGTDLIKQFLDQTKGAEPAADHPAKEHGVEYQDTADIVDGTFIGTERALQRTQGTGADGAGAGIAVDAGDAELLRASLIDIAGCEALEIGVEQQGAVELDDLAPGGDQFF